MNFVNEGNNSVVPRKSTKEISNLRNMMISSKKSSFITRIVQQFNCDVSTEENHKTLDMNFYGKYAHIRKTLDYTYHWNYKEDRQRLQNCIIDEMMDSAFIKDINGDFCTTPTEPWLVFTAGAMGAGKGYTIKHLVQNQRFPLNAFVTVDPDEIRRIFPEYDIYVKKKPLEAGELTRKEAGYVAEILTLAAIQAGKNVLIDGSLRDSDWYKNYFKQLKNEYPMLKIGILHITAPREVVLSRAKERGKLTGRIIPTELLESTIKQVPKSVKILAPLADFFCELSNNPGEDIKIITESLDWEVFQNNWIQTCSWVPGKRKQLVNALKLELKVTADNSHLQEQIKTPIVNSVNRQRNENLSSQSLRASTKIKSLLYRFQVKESTEENYGSKEMKFYGSYAHIRKTLDYNYHSNYDRNRQWLQDSVIEDVLTGFVGSDADGHVGDTPTRPWMIFTSGSKGAGKGYVMNHLLDEEKLPLVGFVPIDPDSIRTHLPEFILYLHENPAKADDYTRREVRYITEITTLAALHSGKNIIVDGVLKSTEWYKEFIARIRSEFSNYRVAILNISAPKEVTYKRASLRAKKMGRTGPPKEAIDITLNAISEACNMLRPFVDYFCELSNPSDDEIEICTDDVNWDSFRKNWLQQIAPETKISCKDFK